MLPYEWEKALRILSTTDVTLAFLGVLHSSKVLKEQFTHQFMSVSPSVVLFLRRKETCITGVIIVKQWPKKGLV